MEHWEPLGSRLRVLVSPSHGFTTDTLLLAHFSLPRPGERCAELGCGCGAISLLWCARARPAHVAAIELQPQAAALAARSVRENGLEELVTVTQGDARDYRQLLPHQGLDRIACNPPYYPAGAGLPSQDPSRRTARHSRDLTLEDLVWAEIRGAAVPLPAGLPAGGGRCRFKPEGPGAQTPAAGAAAAGEGPLPVSAGMPSGGRARVDSGAHPVYAGRGGACHPGNGRDIRRLHEKWREPA